MNIKFIEVCEETKIAFGNFVFRPNTLFNSCFAQKKCIGVYSENQTKTVKALYVRIVRLLDVKARGTHTASPAP